MFKDISEAVTRYPFEKVLFIDTETTGLDYEKDELLSLAICDSDGNQLFYSLFKPKNHIFWREAEKINHITPSMVKNAPYPEDLKEEIQKILLGDKLIAGFNVSFDMAMLLNSGIIDALSSRTFDVMFAYAEYVDKDNYFAKLTTVAKHYGYQFNAHNALDDARATAYCYKKLLTDPVYLNGFIKDSMKTINIISMNQTVKSSENVLNFVDDGFYTTQQAELRLGAITRGKNKGMPRYECYFQDELVGVGDAYSVDAVKKFFWVQDEQSLPEPIPCNIVMSKAIDKAEITVRIKGKSRFKEGLISLAADVKLDSFTSNQQECEHILCGNSAQAPGLDSSNFQLREETIQLIKDNNERNSLKSSPVMPPESSGSSYQTKPISERKNHNPKTLLHKIKNGLLIVLAVFCLLEFFIGFPMMIDDFGLASILTELIFLIPAVLILKKLFHH